MIEIYTDGSCSGNGEETNYGGHGVVVVKNGKPVLKYSIPAYNTTNNREEMKAVIMAIEIGKIINNSAPKEVKIFSDSAYVVQIVNSWMHGWEKKGWRKGDGKEPENLDLVKRLYELMVFERAIKVEKIKGHAGHEFNEMADDLATEATEKAKQKGED